MRNFLITTSSIFGAQSNDIQIPNTGSPPLGLILMVNLLPALTVKLGLINVVFLSIKNYSLLVTSLTPSPSFITANTLTPVLGICST